ncbi:hypothetical protein EC991_005533 [Linnemannia zychae]|nr:hypothetical protein EC991_005533 [Linnemannia zychae]
MPGRIMSMPKLFNLGVMPVRFASSGEPLQTRTLILSDKTWQASFNSNNKFEVQPVLIDKEVSQACVFEIQESENSTRSGFVFIVNNQDLQLVTLQGKRKNDTRTLPLGHLQASGMASLLQSPFYSSLTQQEWKLPSKTLLCVGTGIFSPTGAAASAASPRTGRIIVLSIKHSKPWGHELIEEWVMDMPMPVFAIFPFMENRVLVSSGPVLKLYTLSSTQDSLLEKASTRERWPIVQISSQGKMIVTGSRGESISFYEYEAGSGEHSFDKLKFFRSARSARQVSDCLAITPEQAVGVDLSGCIFGVGYTPGVVNQQYSLVDQFSFHMGEIVTRIRLAKLWLHEGRSLSGIPLPLPTSPISGSSSSSVATVKDLVHPPSFMSMLIPHILIPWTPIDTTTSHEGDRSIGKEQQPTTSNSTERMRPSSQALVGYSLVGSIFGFWRLDPYLYNILKVLQRVLATFYESRPVLGANHGVFRSGHSNTGSGINGGGGGSSGNQPTKAFHTIDGDLLDRFLDLNHAAQIEVIDRAIRLEGMVEEWIRYCDNKDTNTSDTKATIVGGSALAEALDREVTLSNCNERSGASPKCVDRAFARRSMYLNDDGRFLQTDQQHALGTNFGKEGSGWVEEEHDDENEEKGSKKQLDIYHVPCAAIHALCAVLLFLRNLDWHQ